MRLPISISRTRTNSKTQMKKEDVIVGSLVKRTNYDHGKIKAGDIRKVVGIRKADEIELEGDLGSFHDPENLEPAGITHKDIIKGAYYHVLNLRDNYAVIVRADSKDDAYRWTGPTLADVNDANPDDIVFEDGSDSHHGAYFGGEGTDDDDQRIVRYATEGEIAWLDACLDANKLVPYPSKKPNQYVKALTRDMVGKKISCKIQGRVIEEGRIQYENGAYYICQNEKSGTKCPDRLEYKYSWECGNGSSEKLSKMNIDVTEILFLDEVSVPKADLDIKNTKIWVGGDDKLRKQVFAKLKELGVTSTDSPGNQRGWGLYVNSGKELKHATETEEKGEEKHFFKNNSKREIFPADLGIGIKIPHMPTVQIDPEILLDVIMNDLKSTQKTT